jgi:galactokinase/mevalonate kinase-like predicted kinase
MPSRIADALEQNLDLDLLSHFRGLPNIDAQSNAVIHVAASVARLGTNVSRHRGLLVLNRMLRELPAESVTTNLALALTNALGTAWEPMVPHFANEGSTSLTRWLSDLTNNLVEAARRQLRATIVSACPRPVLDVLRNQAPKNTSHTVVMPVRLDLGMGGISDVPPYCFEKYGNCVNVPIRVDRRWPLKATARVLDEPVVEFVSIDKQAECLVQAWPETSAGEGWFRLHDAVLRFLLGCDESSSMPTRCPMGPGRGLRLESHSHLPAGTGLGVSSLLTCALLQAVAGVFGLVFTPHQLFLAAVYVENITGIGGGWEDATALYSGWKLMESFPEQPLLPRTKSISVSQNTEMALRRQLVLIQTGLPKKGQPFFTDLVEQYTLRNGAVLAAVQRNNESNLELCEDLGRGNFAGIGCQMDLQWENWKLLSGGRCTNAEIDCLLTAVRPFVLGARMNGAGQGGTAMFLVRKGKHADFMRQVNAVLRKVAVRYRWSAVRNG